MVNEQKFSSFSSYKQVVNVKSQFWQERIPSLFLRLEEAICVLEKGSNPPLIGIFLSAISMFKEGGHVTDVTHLLMLLTKCGLETQETLGNSIVPLLIGFGKLCDAQRVFNKLVTRNDYSWNSLILGLVNHGEPCHALNLFSNMREDNIKPSGFTFVALIKACASLQDVQRGHELHIETARLGLDRSLFVGSSLIDMYMNGGLAAKAIEVFKKLEEKDVVSWNALLAGFCTLRLFHEVLDTYQQMQEENISPSDATFSSLLRAFSGLEAIDDGLELHSTMIINGVSDQDCASGGGLVDMYASCGFLAEAEKICEKMVFRDLNSWTSMVSGYCKHMLFQEAFNCFKQMQLEGIAPGPVAFVNVLKACTHCGTTDFGQLIHSDLVKKGLFDNNLVNSALIDMYGNSGLVAEAKSVFAHLPMYDVVSWTALIAGYSKYGYVKEAAHCFSEMEKQNCFPDLMSWNTLIEGYVIHGYVNNVFSCLDQMLAKGIYPNTVTFLFCLKACASIADKCKGRQLHIDLIKNGLLQSVPAIGNALVDFYATSRLLVEAQSVLHKLPVQDVVSWTSLMAGYTKHGLGGEALSLLDKMESVNVLPSTVTFVCSLKACALVEGKGKGQELHAEIEKKGLFALGNVGNALVDMYASLGLLDDAQNVFDMLPVKGMIAWTALITGYAKHGSSKDALSRFEDMKSEGLIPDAVSWSSLISVYAMHDHAEEALNCLTEMKTVGICPDAITFVPSLKACGTIQAIDVGQKIHAEVECAGLSENCIVVGNALVDMYASCGCLLDAQYVLDKLPSRDTISWTSLIAGYTKHGFGEEALSCLEKMQSEGVSPDTATFICSLKACGIIGASERGQEIHETIARLGILDNDPHTLNALFNMYTDCGLLAKAYKAFKKLSLKCISLWTAIIAGFAKHGFIEEALKCFNRMQSECIPSNSSFRKASFPRSAYLAEGMDTIDAAQQTRIEAMDLNVQMVTSILTACSHSGLVNSGQSYFSNLTESSLIIPAFEHHVCVIDLLGRAGQLDNAAAFVNVMPYQPTIVVWHTILGASAKWSDLELAKQAFDQALQLDAQDNGMYMSLFNVFATNC